MFLTIVLSLWTTLHLFAFWRIATLPWLARRGRRWALAAGLAAPACAYPLSRFLQAWGLPLAARPVEWIGAVWVGVIFLIVTALVAADAATLLLAAAGFILRRLKKESAARRISGRGPALRLGAIGIGGALSLIAVVQANRPPVVRDYEVRLPGLPAERDGLVVVEVSDLHLGTMTGAGWMKRLVRRIDDMNPDLIVLAGDLLEGHDPEELRSLVPIFGEFRAPLGVWAVMGNHDHIGGVDETQKALEKVGCAVLRNRWAEAAPGLVIAGADGVRLYGPLEPGADERVVAETLAGRPAGATILVCHFPRPGIAEAASRAGVGLMLSGHTHAGQIWPFSYISKAINPLFEGRYDVAGMAVIVCRGTSTWGPPMRLWRPNEIVRVRLRAGK